MFGTEFLIGYKINGGQLLKIIPDKRVKSLIFKIDTNADGSIILRLPRTLIDATYKENDDDFFVLVDGEEVEFEETVTQLDRTLKIHFIEVDTPRASKIQDIEIIGTVLNF